MANALPKRAPEAPTRPKLVPIPGARDELHAPAPESLEARGTTVVLAAILIGGLVRLAFVLSADFPLNDGGLFYAMIGNLEHAGFHLPQTTTYNAAGIPFSYPPLPFYIAAGLSRFTPLSTIEVLHFLPFIVSTTTIGAFYLLARSLLPSKMEHAVATFVFALLPRTSMWMIMGGGLTRSFGLLFMILALQQLHSAYTTQRLRPLLGSMLFGGLTLLSHAEMSLLLLCSGALFFVALGRSRDGVARSISACAGALAVASPWWITIVARDGLTPLLGAGSSRSVFDPMPLFQLITLNLTNERLLPVLSLLGLGGIAGCLAERRFLLPAWLAIAAITESWVFATAIAVPLALMAGIGFARGLQPALERLAGEERPMLRRWLPLSAFCAIMTYAAVAGLVATTSTVTALPKSERSAMAWAAGNLPFSSRVLVISANPWWRDKSAEWFPVLGQRVSVATPQGLEWLPNGAFGDVLDAHEKAQECATRDATCLLQWAASTGISYTHVYVSKTVPSSLSQLSYSDCCPALRASLYNDPAYSVVYDGPGATIFARRAP